MPITLAYASLLAALFTALSARVVLARRGKGISLGTGNDTELERRIRAHANFVEYAPIGLILMGLIEATAGAMFILHGIGVTLLAGRLMHGIAFSFTANWPTGRIAGMVLTFFSLTLAICVGLITALT